MGKGKMDEAAAARIRKARGEKDDFAKRAAIAARSNKDGGSQDDKDGGQSGSSSGNQGGGSKK